MAKRGSNDGDEVQYGAEDNPIGLTGAFAPVVDEQDESEFYDDPVGLTQAFGAVSDDTEWDGGKSKWAGFDWNAPAEGEEGAEDDADADDGEDVEAEDVEAKSDDALEDGQVEGDEPVDDEDDIDDDGIDDDDDDDDMPRGRHAAHAKKSEEPAEDLVATPTPKKAAWMEERTRRSRKTRRSLITAILLLIVLLAAGGALLYHVISQGQSAADQQAQQQQTAAEKTEIVNTGGNDAATAAVKVADVPDVVSLMGLDQAAAIETLGRGATTTSMREVKEEGNPIRTSVTIALTAEPEDAKTGTPNVYLGLDRDGKIIQVGYSASAAMLGFGAVGFADAVQKEHVIEKTMKDIGLTEDIGTITLPANKSEYSTYGSDGTTLVRERCPFSGNVVIGGQDCTWSSVLSYDYTTANLTGNVNDTVRVVYAYVTANVEYVPDEPAEGEGSSAAAQPA